MIEIKCKCGSSINVTSDGGYYREEEFCVTKFLDIHKACVDGRPDITATLYNPAFTGTNTATPADVVAAIGGDDHITPYDNPNNCTTCKHGGTAYGDMPCKECVNFAKWEAMQ